MTDTADSTPASGTSHEESKRIEQVINRAFKNKERTAITCTVEFDDDTTVDCIVTQTEADPSVQALWNGLIEGVYGEIAPCPPDAQEIVSVETPVYSRADRSMIDCWVTFGDGRRHPYTANAQDLTEYGVKLWQDLNAGAYGAIGEFPR
jgi:hypothetical protein